MLNKRRKKPHSSAPRQNKFNPKKPQLPLVGAMVGVLVGDLEGAKVIDCDGALVGALTGLLLGVLTGALVGALIGALVGALVGEATCSTFQSLPAHPGK